MSHPQIGDIGAIDRIMQLRQGEDSRAASPSGSSTAVSTASDHVNTAVDPASVCMALTQATAVFEQWAGAYILSMPAMIHFSLFVQSVFLRIAPLA